MNHTARDHPHLPGITPRVALALDPIIFSAPRQALSGFDFEEEITGMKVTVCVP